VLWALAVGGRTGVSDYLSQFLSELAIAMALCGRHSVAEVDRSLIGRPWR
jgi:isopentenyl diphosphate isomerase/L-lactate dehydrogenase-like FMN-dependent dehydrogenase